MHPIRRRKKRPNYGVRTVEVSRGKNGFGFTISGQQPCILSCIVAGSPAEKAGLRPGDYLVAVNGQSVSKVPHDDVVRLIGCSSGILKLQIAENYYSDSSDEDAVIPARPKPKYMHKPRSGAQHHRSTSLAQQARSTKALRDIRAGPMFEDQLGEPSSVIAQTSSKANPPLPQQWEPPIPAPLPPPRLYSHSQAEKTVKVERDNVEYRALVGYLGTIEMPKELQPGSRLQVVRSCIKRLCTEKRAHTLVLMSVHTQSLTLTNCHKVTLAEYPSERVTFCGTSSDDERRFFGIITTAALPVEDDNDGAEMIHSSSCHVFAIELRLHGSHGEHAAKAEAFKLRCNVDATTGLCSEFPSTSDPIVTAIKRLYSARDSAMRNNNDAEEPLVANSPQPSNASSTVTTASSNSDSGIGFRDDCGNQSDRILVVDVRNQRLHIQQMVNSNIHEPHNGEVQHHKSSVYDLASSPRGNRLIPHSDDRLTVRVMPDPVINLSGALAVSSRSRSPLSSSSGEEERELKSKPCIEMYSERAVDVPEYDFANYRGIASNIGMRSSEDLSVNGETSKSQDRLNNVFRHNLYHDFSSDKTQMVSANFQGKHILPSNCNFSNVSVGLAKSARSIDAMSVSSSQSHDALVSCKLSPKVFSMPSRQVTHSLEDLKVTQGVDNAEDVAAANASLSQHWGSLQELRSFVSSCFESSPQHGSDATVRGVEEVTQEEEVPESGVASWATSFENLLADPAGLHTFAEFLKKEFSHENIYFWVACEKYRSLHTSQERAAAAREIFERHLCLGALEPVNVDSHARQAAQDGLTEAAPSLFLQAQKQIFNLMKFDSYPRFIKSELYKECLMRELSGQELPYPGGDELDTGLQLNGNDETSNGHSKLKKSRSDAEDHRRKSLLPWHRKNRSKSKDRGESEYNKLRMLQQKHDTEDTVSIRSDVTSSRSSLASWDLALRGSFSRQSVTSGEGDGCCTLCRVILPDGATTVVQTRSSESIRDLVLRLLDKRGLHYSSFEVFTGAGVKPLSLDEDSGTLAGKEVRVEQRIVFRLDLPNRKTIGVKAKPGKTLGEVLRPILHKYGYRLELVTLCLMSENEVVELSAPVVSVDNQRLQVLTRSVEAWKNELAQTVNSSQKLKIPGQTLDEITNRVFEELLQGKVTDGTLAPSTSDQESIRESRAKSKKATEAGKHVNDETAAILPKPLIAKWKVGVKLQGRSESDELYEGLKRAQRSRLEDQRGTEINFELPDFLKDKENAPQAGKKFRKLRRGDEAVEHQQDSKSSYPSDRPLVTRLLDQSFVTEGVVTGTRPAEEYSLNRTKQNGKNCRPSSSSDNSSSLDNTLVEVNALSELGDGGSRSRPYSDPPPLPPKPKHLPPKSSLLWGTSTSPTFRPPLEIGNSRFLRPSETKRDVKPCRSRRAVYLDQPSSSFV